MADLAYDDTTTTKGGGAKSKPRKKVTPDTTLDWVADVGTPAPEMPAPADYLEGRSAADKRQFFHQTGSEKARLFGGDLVSRMIRESGMSLSEIEGMTGFSKSSLSKLSNGVYDNGPSLWKVFALADALGYRLDFDLKPRDAG